MMELGATLCSTTNPGCSACPISDNCLALSLSRNSGSIRVTDYPTKVVKAKQRHDYVAVCVVQLTEGTDEESLKNINDKDVLLLVKRPEEGLLAGLWEFPTVPLDGEKVDVTTRRRSTDKYLKELFHINISDNCNVVLRKDVGEHIHIFSHIQLHMHVELLILKLKGGWSQISKNNECKISWKFVDGKSIKTMGLTSGVRKVYNMIQDFKKQQFLQHPTRAPRKKCKSSI
ncbi:adenine DNA glycosylase isoform X1 [Canna indica]|uniref:Adenine DNA glycosylase n=1 Tax=Canna indica TaxID=4628 RepID=A0AAQ3K534_9LILI|nr:adenine DNA glycosylase isoform X1 [Canna indica]